MKKYIKMALFFLLVTSSNKTIGNNIISFFLRPYPNVNALPKQLNNQSLEKKSKKLQRPEKLAQYTLNSLMNNPLISGIFVSYGGQLAISDNEGQVSFSRRQDKPNVKLLITEKIKPIIMTERTIHHWEIEGLGNAKLYSVKYITDNETNLDFWDIQKIELPENNRIALNTIIIFAKPSNIFVPEGITFSTKQAQLILPDIYVRKNMDKLSNAFYILDIKHFFRQTSEAHIKNEKQYIWQLKE